MAMWLTAVAAAERVGPEPRKAWQTAAVGLGGGQANKHQHKGEEGALRLETAPSQAGEHSPRARGRRCDRKLGFQHERR